MATGTTNNSTLDNDLSTTEAPPAVAFKTIVTHFVYGRKLDQLSDDDLISAIRRIEQEIDSLKTVKTTSAKITAHIEELTKMLAEVVTHLDNKA